MAIKEWLTDIKSIFSSISARDLDVKSRFGLYTSHHHAWKIVEPDSGGMHPKNFVFFFVFGDGSSESAMIFFQSESENDKSVDK